VAATAAREALAAVVEVRAGRKGTALPEATTPHHSLALVVVVAVATVAEQQARLRSRRKRGAAPVGTIRMAGAVAQADLPREAERRVLWVVAAAAVVAARPTEEPGAQADQVSILMPRMDLGGAAQSGKRGAGASFGGGGGGSGPGGFGGTPGTASAGAPGLIIIRYTP
jgi:uncharacterized membrane protein YgcG